MNKTDAELDCEWQPNGRRPQSTIARSFSQELMDIFRIENSVADLDEKIVKRRQNINSQTEELEAIEARLRDMEKRLGMQPTPAGVNDPKNETSQQSTSRRSQPSSVSTTSAAAETDQNQKYAGSRPGTARQNQQAVSGQLPPTPVASEGEYGLSSSRFPRQSLPNRIPPSQVVVAANAASTAAVASRTDCHPTTPVYIRPSGADRIRGDDAASVKSERSSADYVVVRTQDGDGEHDL